MLTSEMVMQCQDTTRMVWELQDLMSSKRVPKIRAFCNMTLCWQASGSSCFKGSHSLHILGAAVPEDPEMYRTNCTAAKSHIPDD
jgi:hypothetical protein